MLSDGLYIVAHMKHAPHACAYMCIPQSVSKRRARWRRYHNGLLVEFGVGCSSLCLKKVSTRTFNLKGSLVCSSTELTSE